VEKVWSQPAERDGFTSCQLDGKSLSLIIIFRQADPMQSTAPPTTPAEALAEARKIADNKVEGPY
jgi:hypothetical protein